MKTLKENPVAAQSKQMLLSALLELMEHKPYSSISIKELAECAGLDRKTFYRNFTSKEEVLCLRLQEMCQVYIKELRRLPRLTSYEGTKAYFQICSQHLHFFMLLKKNNLLPLVLIKFDEYLSELNTLFLTILYTERNLHMNSIIKPGDFGMLQSAGWRAVQRKVRKRWRG